MEYQKIIHLLDNTPNLPSKYKTRNCVEINYVSRGMYNGHNQIRFKTSMLRSSICDYSDAFILVKRTITVGPATAAVPNNANKNVIFKNCE